jgi:hypothetical protein
VGTVNVASGKGRVGCRRRFQRLRAGYPLFVLVGASTVAVVAVAAVIIVVVLAIVYIVPRGGRRRR